MFFEILKFVLGILNFQLLYYYIHHFYLHIQKSYKNFFNNYLPVLYIYRKNLQKYFLQASKICFKV